MHINFSAPLLFIPTVWLMTLFFYGFDQVVLTKDGFLILFMLNYLHLFPIPEIDLLHSG